MSEFEAMVADVHDGLNASTVTADDVRAALTAAGVPALLAEVERLREYKSDTDELRRILGDSPGSKLLIELDRLRAAEAELAALRAKIDAAPVGVCVLYDVCGMETPVIDLEMTEPEAFPYVSGQRVRLLTDTKEDGE